MTNDVADDDVDDEPDDEIRVGQLVDAILTRVHSSSARIEYWSTYVRLVREAFGLTKQQNEKCLSLDLAIDDLKGNVLPFSTYLEVPMEIAIALSELGDAYEVRDRLIDLQRRFLLALIRQIDPKVDEYRTTLSELRRTGLTGSPYFSDEDY